MDEKQEIYYYFLELVKLYNEAIFLLRESVVTSNNQYMNARIELYLKNAEKKIR